MSDWRPMTGDDWMDLEPYPGPPHYEPTAQESFAALGAALRKVGDPYIKAFKAFEGLFAGMPEKQKFPIPPRELNRPARNYGPQPKRVFSHRGRKTY